MWRSCPRLRNWGRRVLNWSPGGPMTSMGQGPNTLSPFRDYSPPAGEGGQGTPTLAKGRARLRWAEGFGHSGWGNRGRAQVRRVTQAIRVLLQVRKEKPRPGQEQSEGTNRTHRVTTRTVIDIWQAPLFSKFMAFFSLIRKGDVILVFRQRKSGSGSGLLEDDRVTLKS